MRTRTILAAVLAAALAATSAAQTPVALSGRVVDANTQGAIPADVTVIVETADGMVIDGADAASGAFRMRSLPAGTAIVYAVSEGYSPGWTELSLSTARAQTARLSLKLEAGLSGTVLNGQGEPVSGAFINTEYPDEVGAYGLLDSLTYGQRVTNASGEFDLFGLIADTTVTLQAETSDGVLSSPVTVKTSAGMTSGGVVLRVP